METGDFLTVPDVASRLKVSRETVREWLRTEQLTGYNLGGRAGWRISAVEVDRLLSSRRYRLVLQELSEDQVAERPRAAFEEFHAQHAKEPFQAPESPNRESQRCCWWTRNG